MRVLHNELARTRATRRPNLGRATLAFHSRLPEYAVTPLKSLPDLADKLGLRALWVKDESDRLGLPSFKILGASWATYRMIQRCLEKPLGPWENVGQLAALVRDRLGRMCLASATDGNHGRAVARVAKWHDWDALIFVPRGTSDARIHAIESEGADVIVVDGTYGDAVLRSAREAERGALVVSDTSWPGYEEAPGWVIEGYGTVYEEIDQQLASAGESPPDVVFVQIGVGALAAATVRHYQNATASSPRIIGVEPETAACALASIKAGEIVSVPDPHRSIMVGLNCDSPSHVAWPDLSAGIDTFLAIPDTNIPTAMKELADAGIIAGETGAAGVAGLMAIVDSADPTVRERLGLMGSASVLVLSTEGATDPVAYSDLVEGAHR
jgi:diaminopropionate ammonia-lyase